MKKQITVAALALALGTLAVGVAGAYPGDRMERMFDRLDTDGSGSISPEEASAMHKERFQRMDADENGTLNMEEFAARRGGHSHGHHGGGKWDKDRADRGGDRDARIEQRFQRLDANDDGAVTLEEMKSAASAREDRRAAMRTERFADTDADGDGVVTEAEFVDASVTRMFSHVDSDNDGTITLEEMRKVRGAMHEARKASKAE